MKRKGILLLLIILFIGCLAAGVFGYIQNKQGKNTNKPDDNTPSIKYVYYLEDVEVTKDEVTNSSEFSGSEVSGSTDNEPQFLFSSSSKLYFNKAKYEVTLTITNGELEEGTDTFVKRGETGVFAIAPYEGYEFDTYTCSNNKEAAWDKINNKLTINAITEDVACKVVFKTRTLRMNLTVVNGTGSTSENVEYGKQVTAIISPNTGFENPTIKCTNDQQSKYSSNTITIERLTNDTECTVTYAAVKVEEYTLTIIDFPDTLSISNGSVSQKVEKGSTGRFTITPKTINGTTYSIAGQQCYRTGYPSETISPLIRELTGGAKEYTFESMSKNITCKITAS
jgi:hypothetical protein